MDWQSTLTSILNNPLAGGVINKAIGNKPAPAPKAPTPIIQVANPVAAQGMSQNMMLAIGAGILAIGGILFFALKKR